jgi:hypothetical protein
LPRNILSSNGIKQRISRQEKVNLKLIEYTASKIGVLTQDGYFGKLLQCSYRHNEIDIFRIATFDIEQEGDPTDEDVLDLAFFEQGEEAFDGLKEIINRHGWTAPTLEIERHRILHYLADRYWHRD